MGAAVISSQYSFQKNSLCEHHKNSISDPRLSLFVSELKIPII